MPRRLLASVCVIAALLGAAGCATGARLPRAIVARASAPANVAPRAASQLIAGTHHYEYVLPDQAIEVYDIDHSLRLVQEIWLPGIVGIRGVVASPRTQVLYISHGGDGAGHNGSLLAYDLARDAVLWDRSYDRGVDSMAIGPDGSRIYMPDGELSRDGVWSVIDARSGQVIGRIAAGSGPHNTIVGLSGVHVYLGGRSYPYLDVASTATSRVVKRVGPLVSGVRPFTVNGRETLAYTTATGFLGFQVSSLRTGHVLYTETFGSRFRWNRARFAPSAPSHGISLSPDERQLWVIDAPNSYVHVFDVAGVPRRPPRRIADIKLIDRLSGTESGCSYDCARDGWLQHSRDGCLVFVGDSGDVLSAVTVRGVGFLATLRNTRKHLEIDWRSGRPTTTSSRSGLGYVTRHMPAPPARCR